jgi:hypothetical protein
MARMCHDKKQGYPNEETYSQRALSVSAATVIGRAAYFYFHGNYFDKGTIMKGSFLLVSTVVLAAVKCGCSPSEKSISPEQLEQFQTTVNIAAIRCRENTGVFGEATDKYSQLAEQAAANPEYERQAPREAAIAYRLYAAYLLLHPSGQPKEVKAKDGLPWLVRSVTVDHNVKDFRELQAAAQFLRSIAEGQQTSVDHQQYIAHALRTGMVEASGEQVGEEVSDYMRLVRKVMGKRGDGGSSPSEDVEYLEAYGKGGNTIGLCLIAMRMNLLAKFPGKEVGSTQPCYINTLPNGNTCVRYQFIGEQTILLEWEASKTRAIVMPKTEHARMIMSLVEKGNTN